MLINIIFFLKRCNSIDCRVVTVIDVTVNHGKIPDGEGDHLSFNYHGNRVGKHDVENSWRMHSVQCALAL